MLVTAFLIMLAAAPQPSAPVTSADWMPLVRAGDFAKARTNCEGWLKSADDRAKAEAHKCLANVELGEVQHKLRIEGNGRGGGSIGSGFDEEPALRAVAHLDAAVLLAPQDLSIHQGRLHVLEQASLYERMITAMEQSIGLYKGPDALTAWIAYPARLVRDQPKPAEALLLLLDKHYPGDHRIAGNLAALYAMAERDEEALAWAKKAVAAAPNDPIDNWNLARIYDYTGKLDLADASYQKALTLLPTEQLGESACVYAEFLEKRKEDGARACKLQREHGCSPSACTQ